MFQPLTEIELTSLKNFKYIGHDDSIIYNYLVSPSLNLIIEYNLIPLWLAPNLITILSLIFNIIGFLFVIIECKNDFSKKLSPISTFIITISHYLYIIFDNLDGKQARRTGTSTAYGMLLDHGCDVFTNIIVAFNMSHLLLLGNNSIFSFIFYSGLFLGFFSFTYQEYIFGELLLPPINGANEGNLAIVFFSFCGFVFGGGIYRIKILFWRLGQWIAIGMFGMAIWTTGIQTIRKIINEKGKDIIYTVLIDWIDIILCIIIPFLLCIFNNDIYSFFYNLITLQMSLMYARLTLEIQMAIIIKEKLKYSIGLYFSILVVFTIFIKNYRIFIAIYAYSSLILGTEIVLFVIIRSMEILYYLKIKLLCIESQMSLSNNSMS